MRKGIILALLTALISGFSIYYNKLIILNGIEPSVFNILKNSGAAVILSFFILTTSKRTDLLHLSKANWIKLVILGIIGGGIPFILYFEGLKLVPAANATLIHKSMFVWVALMAIPLLGERINIWQLTGYTFIAWSNLFIGGFKGFTLNSGELMIFTATLFWSVENILVKLFLKEVDAIIAAWGRMFLGVIFIVLFAFYQNKLIQLANLNFSQILPVFTSIILLSGYVVTWYKSLKTVPATLVTSILVLSTPITNILSSAFITRSLPNSQLTSFLISIAGIALIIFFTRKTSGKNAWI